MTFQSIPEAIPIGAAALFSGALAVFAWHRRAMPMAPAFAVMMAGKALWAFGSALEPSIVELPTKRLCIDLRLLGTVVAMLGLVAFVFRFTGFFRLLKPDRFGLICARRFRCCCWPGPIPGIISTGPVSSSQLLMST